MVEAHNKERAMQWRYKLHLLAPLVLSLPCAKSEAFDGISMDIPLQHSKSREPKSLVFRTRVRAQKMQEEARMSKTKNKHNAGRDAA